ncbi:putative permease [Bacillus ectoiniformans]|uniref:AEC family transporter n=1 Tax=Bacillus ectoiniformans TaxID=1494429 RepID=UPI001956C303|nr:AEC family transporter [Bacillus ectoiniformans]MBM7650118.1 putative permease [Bacillus ectoiniformans]
MEFLNVLLPVFGIFALGFIGEKKIGFDTKTISTMSLYLMSPVLVFRTFYSTEFNQDYLYMTMYSVVLCFALIAIVYAFAYIRKYSVTETCAIILASVFMNSGNYGTPVVLLLFGTAGFEYGVILMVIQSLVMCTVGIYFAAKGSPGADGIRSSLRAVQRMPIIYGAMTGGLCQLLHIPVSSSVQQAVDLVADAAIPTIMIVLGMQLAKISIKQLQFEKLGLTLLIRFGLSPLIAFIITIFLPVDEMIRQIMIITAAMPTAANTTMYAIQFHTEPEFVSSATLISTWLSLIVLPIIFLIVL